MLCPRISLEPHRRRNVFDDAELSDPARTFSDVLHFAGVDLHRAWRFTSETLVEAPENRWRPVHLDDHAVARVPDVAAQALLAGQSLNKSAKADSPKGAF